MLNWGMKHLETVLGKTVTGIIGVFALGIFVMWTIPKYVVTTDIFKREVESIYKNIDKGDNCQELKLIELKKIYWDRKLYEVAKEIDKKGTVPTTEEKNLMEKAIIKLESLEKYEEKILARLPK